MKALGLTYIQLRQRLAALDKVGDLLEGQVKKGPKGRMEYTPAVLDMLRDLEQLVNHHNQSLAQATQEVAGKVKRTDPSPPDDRNIKRNNQTADVELARLQEKAAALERENGLLRAELAKTWSLVENLRALPAPRPRRRWWAFGRRVASKVAYPHGQL